MKPTIEELRDRVEKALDFWTFLCEDVCYFEDAVEARRQYEKAKRELEEAERTVS